MRLTRLSAIVVAGLLSAPALHQAAAAPVMIAAPQISSAAVGHSVNKIYYYRGHYYPYHYRGGYYTYSYGGHYYQHRYYRHGHWHYY